MEIEYGYSDAGEKRVLKFAAACDNDMELIVSDTDGKGIFRINKDSKESQLVTILENRGRNVYQGIESFEDEIFLFPYDFKSTDIVIYHTGRKEAEFISLQKENKSAGDNYRPIKRVGNEVWLFPINIKNGIVIFHLDTKRTDIVKKWGEVLGNEFLNLEDWYLLEQFRKVGTVIEEKEIIYHTVLGTNILAAIRKDNYEVTIHKIPVNMEFASGLDYDGRNFWISAIKNQGIIAWNPQDGIVHCYDEVLNEYEPLYNAYYMNWYQTIICGKKYLWIIPVIDNKLLKMDYETGKIENVVIFPETFCMDKGWKKDSEMFSYIARNNHIADLYPFSSNLLIHLDLEKDVLLDHYEKIYLPKEWSVEEVINYELNNGYESSRINESEMFNAYMQSIVKKDMGGIKMGSGEKIWKKLR